ncbi:type VII toxin-antitoxin system HepT family RNase toxin [Brevibacillus dissolubilis]|uniref:type VII toxin-antitoxin system HepT family RNase toxin n=1 Tax=Brevibacillus dissolubilis TaxID=1844116 RepID=UPI0011178E50|nr:HepT-like ribonuclease domain-containing protein [Brevibacillus dissolubilis]
MYDVNTKRIDEVLNHIGQMLALLGELTERQDAELVGDRILTAAMERGLHLVIEGIIDVGNCLIDGFIMRDPGSYADIVEILRDETVVSEEQARSYTDVVEFRKHLINDYTRVPAEEMVKVVRKSLESLHQFAPSVRTYVEKELF